MLHEKIGAEYNTFLKEFEKKEPKEIVAASYEKVFKENILMIFSEHEFPYDRAKPCVWIKYRKVDRRI